MSLECSISEDFSLEFSTSSQMDSPSVDRTVPDESLFQWLLVGGVDLIIEGLRITTTVEAVNRTVRSDS